MSLCACLRTILGSSLILCVGVVSAVEPSATTTSQIKINTYGIHQGNQIVYRYQVENNSKSSIHAVDLGLVIVGKELPGKPWSLNKNNFDGPVVLDATQCKPFSYMTCSVAVFQFDYMEDPKSRISMEGIENSQTPPPSVFSHVEFIRPGTLSSVAELYLPVAYQSIGYLTASGEVLLFDNFPTQPDGAYITKYEIPFTKVDVTPPSLTLIVTPNVIWPPNNKLVPVTIKVSAKDDYDPQPEIKLESITSNESLTLGDIQGAALGTDDRSFSLMATRLGTSTSGRIYTITYSATDGSGNKSIATTTVTVPHDQGK